MIPAGWIIGSVSLIISYAAALLVKQSVEIAEGLNISLGVTSGVLLRYAVPYLITVIFFYFIYRIIPSKKIRPTVALAGSARVCFAYGNRPTIIHLVHSQLYPLQCNFWFFGNNCYSGYLGILCRLDFFVLRGAYVIVSTSRYHSIGKSNAQTAQKHNEN